MSFRRKICQIPSFFKNTGLFLHGQRNIFVVSDKKDGVMTEVCQCNDKWKSMLTFIGEENTKTFF